MRPDSKINKYEHKKVNTANNDKIKLYQSKIDSYQKLKTQENDINLEAGLQKPKKISLAQYELDIDTDPIKTIGYGTDHRDHDLVLMDFDRRAARDDDVVILILFCGVCHSDWHVILNEWKNTKYPMIVGHEITGIVVKVGQSVKKFKINDRVAVGPNYNSCRKCHQCKTGHEQYCENDVTETYNMPDRKISDDLKPTGPITYGGYSNIIVVSEHFVFKLPDDASLDAVAPLLCAGVTMYTPLKELKIGKGSKVGIAGIGGLGHIGIKIARKIGAEVIALTRTQEKLSDAIALGASESLLMSDTDAVKLHENTCDLIIDTIPFNHDITPYLNLLKINGGILWIVGSFFTIATDFDIVNRKGKIIRGSSTAGTIDTQEFLNFCIKENLYPEVEIINIRDINKTHHYLVTSKVRYRYVIDMTSIYK